MVVWTGRKDQIKSKRLRRIIEEMRTEQNRGEERRGEQ